jgi:cytidine kinase
MLVTFSVIIDDIVVADGTTRIGLLGGGGPQTCFGARLFGGTIGIVAGVAEDFDAGWFVGSGVDIDGLRFSRTLPTPRAWQVMEADGRRTEIWRVPIATAREQLHKSLELLPEAYRAAEAFHFGFDPDQPDIGFMRSMRSLPQAPLSSGELFRCASCTPHGDQLTQWLSLCDVFSGNVYEAAALGAPSELHASARWLVEMGTRIAIVHAGSQGSVVCDGARTIWIPACPAQPKNGAVGAGNAYCGAFLADYVRRRDLKHAGCAGAVAAKMVIDADQLPVVNEDRIQGAQRLLENLVSEI